MELFTDFSAGLAAKLVASGVATGWSLYQARLSRLRSVAENGRHHPRLRWIALGTLLATVGSYFSLISFASRIQPADVDSRHRIIGRVAAVTVGQDQTVCRIQDTTGELPVLFNSQPPRPNDIVYVAGRIALTPTSRQPYLVAEDRTVSLTLP